MVKGPTAVDLYAGVGGWSLGLRMAGIGVLASYERWEIANETNRKNNGHPAFNCDIRTLAPSDVQRAEIVVGSPPCTQFSLSNRGGSGDVSDGLQDVFAFLRIVQDLKPSWWVMENVPRLAHLMEQERESGRLHEFSDLPFESRVFDLANFGLPQRRRRCLIGNINFDLLASYGKKCPNRTLADVVQASCSNPAKDPIYEIVVSGSEISEQIPEQFLNIEEERINKAAKTLHPIYNSMPFPDRLDRPSRTVTATCTRVSRESIVIEAPEQRGMYRRLTARERALAQGFPITFQFFGNTHAQKLRMIGNALPPLFAYYVGHAIRGTPAESLASPAEGLRGLSLGQSPPTHTVPDVPRLKYRADRRFRFSIPSLRMKSGMRFELTNGVVEGEVDWHVLYVFGPSKSVRQLRPERELLDSLIRYVPVPLQTELAAQLSAFDNYLRSVDVGHLQSVWSHSGPGSTRPFILLDELSTAGERLAQLMNQCRSLSEQVVVSIINGTGEIRQIGGKKMIAHAPRILSGLIIGAVTNNALSIRPKPLPGSRNTAFDERATA